MLIVLYTGKEGYSFVAKTGYALAPVLLYQCFAWNMKFSFTQKNCAQLYKNTEQEVLPNFNTKHSMSYAKKLCNKLA